MWSTRCHSMWLLAASERMGVFAVYFAHELSVRLGGVSCCIFFMSCSTCCNQEACALSDGMMGPL